MQRISARAFIEKKSFVKIDYNGERVYLVTALPVMADEVLHVLELLRDINERLPFDIVESYIGRKYLSIIFLDIDYFKEINDTLGHVAGDHVLIACAQKLQDNIRKGDWVARYGGDEFLICLHDANEEIAYTAAERIRQRIANLIITFGDQQN